MKLVLNGSESLLTLAAASQSWVFSVAIQKTGLSREQQDIAGKVTKAEPEKISQLPEMHKSHRTYVSPKGG